MEPALYLTYKHTVRLLLPFDSRELELIFQALLAASDFADKSIELSLPDDAEMAELNSQSMGCVGPTNVLSFPAPEEEKELLGWMALAPETCAREAFFYGQAVGAYALSLFVHGFAHLLGYEHGKEMAAEEKRLRLLLQRFL